MTARDDGHPSATSPTTKSPREVRILLVGDTGVGKTSLIFSLVSEEFRDEVPPRAEEITIPPDVTPDRVTTHIVDYSDQEQTQAQLVAELHAASVICIVYSVESDESIDRLTTVWLSLIRDVLGEDHKKPVVLVGNKTDLVDYSSLDVILPIMNSYPEIETCVECSAKSLKNIAELFFYAQKAVLHPTAPLYSVDNRDLTLNCKRALTRIFKLSDDNNDGILSDDELNAFQNKCFGSPLQPQALEDVKNIVKRNIRDGIFDDGLTLTGFLFLHTLFIQRGRHETTWTVLRKFGYNDAVELDEDFLHPPLDIPRGSSVELTNLGYRFLTNLFYKFDADGDDALSPIEMEGLFSVCPKVPAFFEPDLLVKSVQTNDNGWPTLGGFLSAWTLMTHVEGKLTLEYLAYLAFSVSIGEETQLPAIQVTRDKRVDLEKGKTTRNVLNCHVIGPQGAGKSCFMKGLLGLTLYRQELLKKVGKHSTSMTARKNHLDLTSMMNDVSNCCSSKESKKLLSQKGNFSVSPVPVYGQEKYLVIREVDIFTLTDKLTEPDLFCDVVCLTYDLTNPHSFEYIAPIYLKHFSDCRLPILILGMKADQTVVRQDYPMQPEEFCAKYKLALPQVFSVSPPDGLVPQDVYVKLATMAAYPTLARLVHVLALKPTSTWVTQHFNALHRIMPESATMVRAGIGLASLASLALASIILLRFFTTAAKR